MFAKYWESGKVKTRLADSIGAEAARDVYVLFLKHLLDNFSTFGDKRTLVFSPTNMESRFRELVPLVWELEAQSDGDLGKRMDSFFQTHGSSPAAKTILIGSDTPDLPIRYAEHAAELLDEASVVLGPSCDGGYYLIAMSGTPPDVFSGVDWSTDRVLAQTIEKLQQLDIEFRLLPELNDVDQLDDLCGLISKLGRCQQRDSGIKLLHHLEALELPDA